MSISENTYINFIDDLKAVQDTSEKALNVISALCEIAINDAAFYEDPARNRIDQPKPVILSDDNLALLHAMQIALNEINKYHIAKYEQLLKDKVVNDEPFYIEPFSNDTPFKSHAELVKERIEKRIHLHAPKGLLIETEAEVKDATVLEEEKQPPESSSMLPKVKDIFNGPAPRKSPLALLVSNESPLYDIFACAPWFPQGRGSITVGSPGFNYIKNINPITTGDNERSGLPNGFYGLGDKPDSVVLRLDTVILIWDFAFELSHMQVFVVGVSDANPPNYQWYNPETLSASFTTRIVNELNLFVNKLKTA